MLEGRECPIVTPRRKKLSDVYERIMETRKLIQMNLQMIRARFQEALQNAKVTKHSFHTLRPIIEQSENDEPFRVHTRSRGKAMKLMNV